MNNLATLSRQTLYQAYTAGRERLPKPLKDILLRFLNACHSIMLEIKIRWVRWRKHFKYSKKWYEQVYHAWLPSANYQERMQFCEKTGSKKRLFEVFDEIDVHPEGEGCVRVLGERNQVVGVLRVKIRLVNEAPLVGAE